MNQELIDINLERAAVAEVGKPARRRSHGNLQPIATEPEPASPEAFDEVFASLSQKPVASQTWGESTSLGKPSLNAAPLLALAASLERQHERLAALLREIESGDWS
jgi:hypothetical protein